MDRSKSLPRKVYGFMGGYFAVRRSMKTDYRRKLTRLTSSFHMNYQSYFIKKFYLISLLREFQKISVYDRWP